MIYVIEGVDALIGSHNFYDIVPYRDLLVRFLVASGFFLIGTIKSIKHNLHIFY